MTYQEAENYLRSYRKLKDKSSYLQKRREKLKSRLYTIKTSGAETVSGGIKDEALLTLLDKITEVERKMHIEEKESTNLMYEIQDKINRLPYPYDAILRRYYIEFKTLEQISVDMHYCYRNVLKIKKKGITKFAIMENSSH